MYGASNSIWEMTIGYKAHDANKSCKKLSLMLRAALTWYRIIATCAKKKTYNIHAIEAVPSPMPDKHMLAATANVCCKMQIANAKLLGR